MRSLKRNDVVWPFVIYAALIYAAEVTFGNPYFSLHLWRFDTVPAWMWSVPIHAAGFVWIVRTVEKYQESAIKAAAVSFVFFAEGELLNLAFFKIFAYRSMAGSQIPAFLLVLAAYFVLCFVMVRMLSAPEPQR